MAVVHIPAAMRKHTNGETQADVPGSTLGEVMEHLAALYPDLKDRLVQGDRIKPGLVVFVNGEMADVYLNTPVPEGAELYFAPAIAGGQEQC